MSGIFPTRQKPFWQYSPLVSIAALFWWMTGLGLWIHFTNVAYIRSGDAINILQVEVNSGAAGQVNRIYSSMVATSIVFTIFAVCIHALGIWRGIVEQEQDILGQVDDYKGMYITYLNIMIQVAWWVIVLWQIIMLTGFGAFSAFIYLIKTSISNILVYQVVVPPGPISFGYCPTSCMSILTTGLFTYAIDNVDDSTQFTLCICDPQVLSAALDAVNTAYNAVPGMLVGVLLMITYGLVLLAYMVGMLVKTHTEEGVSERLTDQGYTAVKTAPGAGRR